MKKNIVVPFTLLALSQIAMAQQPPTVGGQLQQIPDLQAMAARSIGQYEASSPASIGEEQPMAKLQQLKQWVLETGDNRAMPFVIIDKVAAKVFVFHPDGQLRAASPALLGLAQGDDTVPGIGERQLSTIRADERTTPAGRFVASLASTLQGNDILWVDYESAVALHRVVDIPNERRLQRLASSRPADRRITYGCINVPGRFFDTVVRPAFKGTNGIVYVLPETRSLQQVFGSHDVTASPGSQRRPH